jgi:hypothetical protein
MGTNTETELLEVPIIVGIVRDEKNVGFRGTGACWIPTKNPSWVDEPSKESLSAQGRQRYDLDDYDEGETIGTVYVRKGGPAGVVDVDWI